MPFLCRPAPFHLEFKRHTSDFEARPPWVAVSRTGRIDHVLAGSWHKTEKPTQASQPAATLRPGSAVSSYRSHGRRNQWRHHGGEQKPALARSHRHRLFYARLQDRATILRRQPCPSTGGNTLQGCQRAARRARIGTLMRIGSRSQLDARRSELALGASSRATRKTAIATEGVSQTCPILARGRSQGSGVALR